ncbi:MAG: hypothetical protein HZC02_02585 [Candidatus Levybacteria bacterium]|nr:hypothetical protein [Candidatus Levybacteria bacterium]
MKHKTYLVLLVDRVHAKMFVLLNDSVKEVLDLKEDYVPQTVKHIHGERDARDNASRHIELLLSRHLHKVAKEAYLFANKHTIDALVIGTHKPLFGKIKDHLSESLNKKLLFEFPIDLKVSFGEIVKKVKNEIKSFEEVKIDEE